MNSDKILVFLAVIIVSATFALSGKIVEEYKLYKHLEHAEATWLSDNVLDTYPHLPLTSQERISVLNHYINSFIDIQKRASESLVFRFVIDLRDDIIRLQSELMEKQQELDMYGEVITFSTQKHEVVANAELPKELLLHVGHMVDQVFIDEEPEAIFAIDYTDEHLSIEIIAHEGFKYTDENLLKNFGDQVSKEAFEEIPVVVTISIVDPDADDALDAA